jgi:hypothetical protein
LLDQYGGKVKAKIQVDLYGDNKVVLPMPEPSRAKPTSSAYSND